MERDVFLIAGVSLGDTLCAQVCSGTGVAVPGEAWWLSARLLRPPRRPGWPLLCKMFSALGGGGAWWVWVQAEGLTPSSTRLNGFIPTNNGRWHAASTAKILSVSDSIVAFPLASFVWD